jgi:hypothetical protein
MREVNFTPDDEFNIDGIATITRKQFIENSTKVTHKVLHLSALRIAQMLTFVHNDVKVSDYLN